MINDKFVPSSPAELRRAAAVLAHATEGEQYGFASEVLDTAAGGLDPRLMLSVIELLCRVDHRLNDPEVWRAECIRWAAEAEL